MSSCGHSLAAVCVAYNERKWLEKKEEGGGRSSGSSKRMPGDLCVIAVDEIGLYASCPSLQIS